MDEDRLRLYRMLSRAPFPKSYVGKVFLSAFLGTHVPLLALLVYLVHRRRFATSGALRITSVTVPATAVGTAQTLWGTAERLDARPGNPGHQGLPHRCLQS
jgi:hypothetical protein